MAETRRADGAGARGLFIANLHVRYGNDDLIDLMRQMRDARKSRPEAADDLVTCMIDGFNDDPRELGEIPEVRAFCRRLVDTGFISWLNVTTTILEMMPKRLAAALEHDGMMTGLGAFEVWSIAEGFIGKAGRMKVPTERLRAFHSALSKANERCPVQPSE